MGVAEGLAVAAVGRHVVASQEVPPSLADHAAECLAKVGASGGAHLFDGEHSGGVEAGFHSAVDAGEVGELQAEESMGQVVGLERDEAVGLLHVRADFGQKAIGGDADAGGDRLADFGAEAALHVSGDFLGSGGGSFFAKESEAHLVDAADFFDGQDVAQDIEDSVVVANVDPWAGGDDDDLRALLPRFANHRAGFDALWLGLDAGGDDEGRLGVERCDGHRPVAEFGPVLLFDTGEVRVDVEEEVAQRTVATFNR